MKLTINKANTAVTLKDGRKNIWTIDGITLHPNRLAGLVAAQDPEAITEDELREAIAKAAAKKGSIVPDEYRYRYGVDQNCGDDVALRLKAATTNGAGETDMNAVRTIADRNGLADRFDGWVAKGLNNGQLRMNLGNMLRGKARKGEEVAI